MDFPKSVPSVGLVNGKFVDEDTNTATPGSLIPAAWGNAVTGEIINVIEQAGLEPTEGQNDQLFTAISQLISENLSGQATEAVAGVAKIASDADFTAPVADDTKMVTVQKIKTWFSTLMKQATEAAFGWAKIATQAQTNSGADDSTIVTPKKLSVALAALVTQATEAIAGLLKIATQAQVNAHADDTAAVTSKKLGSGIVFSHGATSYRKTPDWLDGGVIEAWGQGVTTSTGRVVITLPLAMANTDFVVSLTGRNNASAAFSGWANEVNAGARTNSTFEVGTFTSSAAATGNSPFQWRVIGKAP